MRSAALLSLVVVVGCARGPGRVHPPSISASAAGDQAVEMYDADKNGKIEGAELDRCPALKAAMAQIDTSGEKSITADEIAARIKTWQRSKIGRMRVSCMVLRNGRPLSDAEVKFVPETFLGDDVQAAAAKTNRNGLAMVSVPVADGNNLFGVAPGLYRVEIAKAGDPIPPKYNTSTTLGQEVAPDAPGIAGGGMVTFNLDY